MDRLRCIEVFVEVARAASFSAAARNLALSNGSVTKHVARLEEMLGIQLLMRSTRQVSMTDAGLDLFERGEALLQEMAAFQSRAHCAASTNSGRLRIGLPALLASRVAPLVANFVTRHPTIDIHLCADEGKADLVAQRLDMTIRIAPMLRDSSLVARKIATVPQCLVATRAYLEQHGVPQTLNDLLDHSCLVDVDKAVRGRWVFEHIECSEQVDSIAPRGPWRADFGEPLLGATLLDRGLSIHPRFVVEPYLRDGALCTVLDAWRPQALDIYGVYVSRKNVPARVTSFVDYLKLHLAGTD